MESSNILKQAILDALKRFGRLATTEEITKETRVYFDNIDVVLEPTKEEVGQACFLLWYDNKIERWDKYVKNYPFTISYFCLKNEATNGIV